MHCVGLGESFPTSIYLQNLASIQPRTSLVKFARSPRTDYYYRSPRSPERRAIPCEHAPEPEPGQRNVPPIFIFQFSRRAAVFGRAELPANSRSITGEIPKVEETAPLRHGAAAWAWGSSRICENFAKMFAKFAKFCCNSC